MFTRQIRKTCIAVIGLVFILTWAGTTMADKKQEAPVVLRGGKIITAEEVKSLLDKNEVKFFDSRSPVNYGRGHIPTAISFPYRGKSKNKPDFDASLDKFNFSKLPPDKNTKIVFYGYGPEGWKSYKAAVTAIKAGYKNIMWYRSGSEGWEAKGYPILW